MIKHAHVGVIDGGLDFGGGPVALFAFAGGGVHGVGLGLAVFVLVQGVGGADAFLVAILDIVAPRGQTGALDGGQSGVGGPVALAVLLDAVELHGFHGQIFVSDEFSHRAQALILAVLFEMLLGGQAVGGESGLHLAGGGPGFAAVQVAIGVNDFELGKLFLQVEGLIKIGYHNFLQKNFYR